MGGREVSRPYRIWFFAEGDRFLSFWRCHRPRWRGRRWWCGVADSSLSLKPQTKRTVPLVCDLCGLLEIRHATSLTTGAKHWHRQKAVFYVFVSVPQFLSTEPRVGRGINLFFTIITYPLRGSTPHHILITKLRSIALQFSLAWCFA